MIAVVGDYRGCCLIDFLPVPAKKIALIVAVIGNRTLKPYRNRVVEQTWKF
jgi:hypothetical protein